MSDDRPTFPGPEITEPMLEAGAETVMLFDEYEESPKDAANRLFLAMLAAAPDADPPSEARP